MGFVPCGIALPSPDAAWPPCAASSQIEASPCGLYIVFEVVIIGTKPMHKSKDIAPVRVCFVHKGLNLRDQFCQIIAHVAPMFIPIDQAMFQVFDITVQGGQCLQKPLNYPSVSEVAP